MIKYLLCCDWGTSFFRLRVMRASDHRCMGEVRSPMGIAGTFDGWKLASEQTGIARGQFFRRQLSEQIDRLAADVSMRLAGIPIVISEMASSSIGMEEIT